LTKLNQYDAPQAIKTTSAEGDLYCQHSC